MKIKKSIQSQKKINPLSEKGKVKKEAKKRLLLSDFEFYQSIWDEREHYCSECGKGLPEPPLSLFFHHLLPKRNYPELRHVKENICILCGDCHSQCEIDIDKTPKVKQLTSDLQNKMVSQET